MSRPLIERRLVEISTRLKSLREDLRITEEQYQQVASEAEDSRIRALVSETPLADRDRRDTQRHAETMDRHRTKVAQEIIALEQQQDELLDKLTE